MATVNDRDGGLTILLYYTCRKERLICTMYIVLLVAFARERERDRSPWRRRVKEPILHEKREERQ